MGYDPSYHPVDLSLLNQTIMPYLLGAEWPEGFEEDAVRLAQNRYRANAWGLGALKFKHSFQKEESLLKDHDPIAIESDLHIWGRPFFITDSDPQSISRSIDDYLKCRTFQEVDAIAHRMLVQISPDMAHVVVPDTEGGMPTAEDFRERIFWRMRLFKQAVAGWSSGKDIKVPNGQLKSPQELLVDFLPNALIELMSLFRPGWMARGYEWPTYLMNNNGMDASVFVSPACLFTPLVDSLPGLKYSLNPTITENYTMGGYLPTERVLDVLSLFTHKLKHVLEKDTDEENSFSETLDSGEDCDNEEDWDDEDWDDDSLESWDGDEISLLKIVEALHDAHNRGFAFVEADTVYSGYGGKMN